VGRALEVEAEALDSSEEDTRRQAARDILKFVGPGSKDIIPTGPTKGADIEIAQTQEESDRMHREMMARL